jgi:hypothetical protein
MRNGDGALVWFIARGRPTPDVSVTRSPTTRGPKGRSHRGGGSLALRPGGPGRSVSDRRAGIGHRVDSGSRPISGTRAGRRDTSRWFAACKFPRKPLRSRLCRTGPGFPSGASSARVSCDPFRAEPPRGYDSTGWTPARGADAPFRPPQGPESWVCTSAAGGSLGSPRSNGAGRPTRSWHPASTP